MNNPFVNPPPYAIELRINPPGYHLASGWDEAKLSGTDRSGNPAVVQLTRAMGDPQTVRASLMAPVPADRRDVILSGIPKGSIESCAPKAWALIFASFPNP